MTFLNRLYQQILTPHCVGCGSFLIEDSLLCRICTKQFVEKDLGERQDSKNQNANKQLRVSTDCEIEYLIGWGAHNQKICSEIIYRIKNSRCQPAIKYYAFRLFSELMNRGCLDGVEYMVSIPGSTEFSNHAESIATEISLLAKIPLKKWLVRDSSVGTQEKQKNLKSIDRKNRRIYETNEAFEKFSKNLRYEGSSVLLIDDVVTTGETIKQCSRLLSPYFVVKAAALFHRRKHSG